MENAFKNSARPAPIQISEEEIGIINDIRKMDFGKITVSIQNGVIVSKEVTIITKTKRNKNQETRNYNFPEIPYPDPE